MPIFVSAVLVVYINYGKQTRIVIQSDPLSAPLFSWFAILSHYLSTPVYSLRTTHSDIYFTILFFSRLTLTTVKSLLILERINFGKTLAFNFWQKKALPLTLFLYESVLLSLKYFNSKKKNGFPIKMEKLLSKMLIINKLWNDKKIQLQL